MSDCKTLKIKDFHSFKIRSKSAQVLILKTNGFEVVNLSRSFLLVFAAVFLPNLLLGQIPSELPRPSEVGRFGDDDFPTMLGEDAPDSAKTDEKGRLILEKAGEDVYGTGTTFYIYEKDMMEKGAEARFLDTLLSNMSRYNYVARNRYMYQDLGTVGTAIQPLYYHPAHEIGTRWGNNILDPYIPDNEEIRYFDSKSPFTSWYYVQGAARSVIDVTFTRNINPNWNVAIRHIRLHSQLLVGYEPVNRNDRQVAHENYQVSTRFQTKNGRYKLLAYASAVRHRMQETGGIVIDSVLLDSFVPADTLEDFDDVAEDLFNLLGNQLENRLENVDAERRREKIRVAHQYSLFGSDIAQVYHTFDQSTHLFNYTDNAFGSNSDFYENNYFGLQRLSQHYMRYQQVENQVGLKGEALKLFYQFYGGLRQYAHRFEYILPNKIPFKLPSQQYAGFKGVYRLTPTIQFRGEYETLIGGNTTGSRVYASLDIPYFHASHKRVSAEPDVMSRFYFGNHFQWDNSERFVNQNYASTEARFSYQSKNLVLKPFARLTEFDNYLYYDLEALPQQFNEKITLFQGGVDMELHTWYIHQKLFAHYTYNSNDDFLRTPEYFANYQLYFQKWLFNEAIDVQIGFDIHWNSEFFADAYMPVTQQFHLQNDLLVGDYFLTDFFVNFTMKKVNFFAKLANVAQGLRKDGYYITPGYMGQVRSFEFGLVWLLFD